MFGRGGNDEQVIRPHEDGETGEILTAPRFYWGCCMVCQKAGTPSAPLKRCAGCGCIFYCSKECQRSHWRKHKRMCQYLSAAAEEVGAKTFFGKEFQDCLKEDHQDTADDLADQMSGVDIENDASPEAGNMDEEPIEEEDKASSWKSWTKFRKNAVQMAQVLLGGGSRPLQEWEKEMFLFPKACRVCRLAELDMYDCHKCQLISSVTIPDKRQCTTYCSPECRDSDAERHVTMCSELKYAMVLDNYESTVSIAAPPISPDVDQTFRFEKYLNRDIKDYLMDQCQWPRTSSLYGDERKSKKNKKRASQTSSGASDEVEVDYDEMEFRFLSDRLSGPLTIIHAMASVGDDIAAGVEVSRMRDLTVHIVGANVNEMLGIIKWEYLAHRLPALEKCRIVFIGPELAEQGETENGECEGLSECGECRQSGKSMVYEVRPMTYHAYVQEGVATGYYTVPDVVCAFNCGFHEFDHLPEREEWSPTLSLLVEHTRVPLIFTSYTKSEAKMDLQAFKRQFPKSEELAKLKFDLVGEPNPFRSHRPVRDFECDDDRDVFYANQFVTVVRRIEEVN